MAEFTEVVKQYRRMIKTWKKAGVVTDDEIENGKVKFEELSEYYAKAFECYVMRWAEEHSEQKKYPSWANYLHSIGVLGKYLPNEVVGSGLYTDLTSNRIPADIAEKLGIKPLEE